MNDIEIEIKRKLRERIGALIEDGAEFEDVTGLLVRAMNPGEAETALEMLEAEFPRRRDGEFKVRLSSLEYGSEEFGYPTEKEALDGLRRLRESAGQHELRDGIKRSVAYIGFVPAAAEAEEEEEEEAENTF